MALGITGLVLLAIVGLVAAYSTNAYFASWVWKVLGLRVDVSVYTLHVPFTYAIIEVKVTNYAPLTFKGSLRVVIYMYDSESCSWKQVYEKTISGIELAPGEAKVYLIEYFQECSGYFKVEAYAVPE